MLSKVCRSGRKCCLIVAEKKPKIEHSAGSYVSVAVLHCCEMSRNVIVHTQMVNS